MKTRQPKPNRKLLDYQVLILREMHRAKYPQKFILSLFGISRTAFWHITRNGSYKWVR